MVHGLLKSTSNKGNESSPCLNRTLPICVLMNRSSLPILGFQLCPGLQAEPCVFMSSSGGWCKVCGESWSAQWNLGCSLGKSSLVKNDLLGPSSRYQNSFIYELLLSFGLSEPVVSQYYRSAVTVACRVVLGCFTEFLAFRRVGMTFISVFCHCLSHLTLRFL